MLRAGLLGRQGAMWIGLLALGGCANRAAEPAQPSNCAEPAATAATAAGGDVVVDGIRYDAEGRARHAPRVTQLAEEPLRVRDGGMTLAQAGGRFEARSLGAVSEPQAPRPRRVGRRDIAVHRARLDNALRVIADAGGFNLVTHGAMGDLVSLQLRGVEPYDALLALAEAHDLQVQFRDGIVVARPTR